MQPRADGIGPPQLVAQAAAAVVQRLVQVEARAVVAQVQRHADSVGHGAQSDVVGLGVPRGVGQCLLQDAQDVQGTARVQPVQPGQVGHLPAQGHAGALQGVGHPAVQVVQQRLYQHFRFLVKPVTGVQHIDAENSDRLLLEPVNLLILDEPTNHLDMQSKDVLKEAIKAFDGTAIIVSHDREFLDGLVTKVYEFGNKKVREHMGGIYDFLRKKKIQNLNELELSQSPATKSDTLVEKEISGNKLNYEARKELSKKIRKAEKEVEIAENVVEKLETEISEMQSQLENPVKASDPEFIMLLQKKQRELEQKMYEWEILAEELEKLAQ